MSLLYNPEAAGHEYIKPPKFNSFLEAVEWSLMFLNFEHKSWFVGKSVNEVIDFGLKSLKTFDGAILLGSGHEKMSEFDRNYSIDPIKSEVVCLSDIDFDLSGCKFYQLCYSGESNNLPTCLHKYRFMEPQELRGTPHAGKRIIEGCSSFLLDNEKWFSFKVYYWLIPGRSGVKDRLSLVFLNHRAGTFSESEIMKGLFEESLKVQMANYYQWFAYIKEEKSMGFRIPIAPESSKDIFELRDVSEHGRKKAILHWVSQHYRNIKSVNDIEEYRQTLVKQHMRGETKFRWKGLEVNLIPAKYDIKRVNSKKKFISF